MPKLLVVDKSVFHAFYDCDEKLCAFVKDYNVVLPHTLAIECVISENKSGKDLNKEPDKLFRGLVKGVKAGANLGYESSELLNAEEVTLCPVKSIIDEANTQQFRNSEPDINECSIKKAANHCRHVTNKKIEGLLELGRTLYEKICENQNFLKNFRKPTNIKKRFDKWIQIIDHDNLMKDSLKVIFSEKISYHADSNWYTWQFARLWFTYCWEWSHKRSLPGSCKKIDISNDFYDIEPVLYLLRADGLLTNDQKLQVPLAKAAYPKKEGPFVVDTRVNDSRKVQDVFDDVVKVIPPSYRI